jgi:hypothetical protein
MAKIQGSKLFGLDYKVTYLYAENMKNYYNIEKAVALFSNSFTISFASLSDDDLL